MNNAERNKAIKHILNGNVWQAASQEDYEAVKHSMLHDLFVAVTSNKVTMTISKSNIRETPRYDEL